MKKILLIIEIFVIILLFIYIVLKINESDIKDIDSLIERLNNRNDVMRATKLSLAEKSEFTEFVPGKTVLLLNRYYPFSKEYSGFKYPRKHRMIYYYITNYADLVSDEEMLEFVTYSFVYKRNTTFGDDI